MAIFAENYPRAGQDALDFFGSHKVSNMKHFVLAFLIFFTFAIAGMAQTTLTSAYIPQIGDTLYQATDNLPSGIEISGPGPNQRWDFTTLQAPFSQSTGIRPADEGSSFAAFPSANAVSGAGGPTEFYYRITNTRYELVGIAGYDPLNLGLDLTVRVNPSYIERRAPLRYGDQSEANAAVAITFPSEDLPQVVLDQLPIRPDSFRLRTTFKQQNIVDAWGALTVPGGIYDVLREKRTETTETTIEAKLGFLPWQDITGLLPIVGNLPRDTITNYYYFSNEAKEPIAILTTDNFTRRVTRAVFKAVREVTTSLDEVVNTSPGVYAFPNPAIVNVRFEFANLPPGEYQLAIYNILGVKVWTRRYFINGPRTEKIDISSLRKGTYLYSLTNERGKTITTRRLMVIRP